MNKIKHFGNYVALIMKRIYWTLRDKRFYIILAFILWSYLIAWFNSNYEIKTSFKFGIYKRIDTKPMVATVSAQLVQPLPTVIAVKPVLTEKEVVMSHEYGEDLWKIYFLESTLGKNDGCRKDGKFGGFGVMSQGKVMCYETFTKAVDRAEYWWKQALDGNTKDEALCVWNLGKAQKMCNYSMTFNSL